MKLLTLLARPKTVMRTLAPSNLWRKGWLIRSSASRNPPQSSQREESLPQLEGLPYLLPNWQRIVRDLRQGEELLQPEGLLYLLPNWQQALPVPREAVYIQLVDLLEAETGAAVRELAR